jgi:Tol biopolymer transport system component
MSTTRQPARRAAAVGLLAGVAVLAAGASAHADSIVYVDGGNVWSASPDGARKVQLTDGGDWHSPTQADDGTIAAVKGLGPIQVLAADGRPIRTITTEPARSGDGGTFAARPVQLSFSPDGSRIAYSYVANSCPDGSTCGTVQRSTFYTYANVTEASPQSLFGEQFSVSDPEWITNDRTIVFGGFGTGVAIDDLAGGGDSSFTRWIPRPAKDVADGEVSRDGKRLVFVSDYGAKANLLFSAVSGDVKTQNPPPDPTPACNTGTDSAFSDPSWSPDSTSVAFHDSDGIETLRFSGFGPNHCEITGPSKVLAAGGSEPDWGPADPPAARYAGSTTPGTGTTLGTGTTPGTGNGPGAGGGSGSSSGGSGPGGGKGSTSQAGSSSVTIRVATLSTTKLRRGRASVRITTGGAGTVAVRVSSGRTTIATGRASAKRAGTVTVRLSRAKARGLRALRGRGNALVSVTVSGKGHERLEGSRMLRVR